MKTILALLIFMVTVSLVFADELYFWTDESGIDHSSKTKPAWWKTEEKWTKTGHNIVSQPDTKPVSQPETKGSQARVGQPRSEKRTVETRPPTIMLPSYVYRIDQLGAAQGQAKTRKSPIAFLYTDEYTDCSLAIAASLDVLREFKDGIVIIYISSEDDDTWARLPRIVRNALNSDEAGRFIPKTVVVNSEINKVISIIPYMRSSGERAELLRKVNNTVSHSNY
ncbi:MAG: hypothetical protein HZB33_06000 [Nitrospirae bacterium]|nr:hypothetical protein [Nitrospirota bacterium]